MQPVLHHWPWFFSGAEPGAGSGQHGELTLDDAGTAILNDLQAVTRERELRAADPALSRGVAAVKAYQHRRFAMTYADLMAQKRYTAATSFFLNDLYGPADYSDRDRQFMRIVPAMVRLFPAEIVLTVRHLGALHALSEQLDTKMARALAGSAPSGAAYTAAWCCTSEADREQQIQWMLRVGTDLDRYTRRVVLRQSLRLMRGPAQAAGLGGLQRFLEKGFDTFRQMGGAEEFLLTIGQRERVLATQLFKGLPAPI
jgi:hypothetical protein